MRYSRSVLNPSGSQTLKKLLSKLGRLALLFMAISGQIEMILWIATFSERSKFIYTYEVSPALNATAWHLRHGNTVAFDGHIFHLPSSWYPDPDSHPGELDFRHTALGSIDLDTVHLTTTALKLDDQSLQDYYAKATAHFNGRSAIPDEWKQETLTGRRLTFHCIASRPNGMLNLLACQAAGSTLRVNVVASDHSRVDALNILETSE